MSRCASRSVTSAAPPATRARGHVSSGTIARSSTSAGSDRHHSNRRYTVTVTERHHPDRHYTESHRHHTDHHHTDVLILITSILIVIALFGINNDHTECDKYLFLTEDKNRILFGFQKSPNTE